MIQRFYRGLETRWLVPSYAGGVIAAISLAFFAAALNTMAGWLYVLSGTMFAMLALAAWFSLRSLKKIQIRRQSISPISAGDTLAVELAIENLASQPKSLLQVQDLIPFVLGEPAQKPIEVIPPKQTYPWLYNYPTTRRGVYRWSEVQIRSGSPLGLFWCRRLWEVPGKAIVYPTILPLNACPLVDQIGQDENNDVYSNRQFINSTEGMTKSIRPYRIGDPIRLVHWRSTARFGEFQVRELEIVTGGQEVIIALDTANSWESEAFEQAVIAAASIYFYAEKHQFNVKLWTAATGLLKGKIPVLEALAATYAGEEITETIPSDIPAIWLTSNPFSIQQLNSGSRWLLFSSPASSLQNLPGLAINTEESLQSQLQKSLH